MYGFVLVGMATQGRWKGQWVLVSNYKVNALAQDENQAKEYLEKAKNSISQMSNPDIDISTIRIAPVVEISQYHPREIRL